MIEVKDALSQVYDFSYDALGRQLSQTRAGTSMSYDYDAIGNRTKRTDYVGRQTSYEYDVLNRLKKISYLSGASNPTPILTATYNYDDLSRLTSAINETGTVSFTYDNRGRMISTTDVFGHLLNYGYDANGNRNLLKFDTVNYATYAYDLANRLTTLTNVSDATNITYGYDNANKLTSRTYPNGVNTTYNYDGMSRLTRLKDASSTATLFDRQYAYNTANQINQITEPTQTRIFGYDSIDRLTSMTGGTANENYSFDAVGNRTSSSRSASYTYQPNNKLTSTATASYNYDVNGNMVSKAEGSNFWHYIWDYENRLTTASTRRQTVRYLYDALGRRVQRHLRGTKEITKFIYDGQDVLVDDNSGTLTKYLNGLGIDNKLRVQTGSTVNYFLTDQLGSTNGLTDSSGSLTSSTSYDSFGNAANTNFPTRYQFTGREFDKFSGLHYYRARFYDANLGRFISEDPIGFAGGDVNLFGYVGNSPIKHIDSLGKQRVDATWKTFSPEDGENLRRAINATPMPTEPLRCGPSPGPLEWLVPDRIGGFGGYFGSKFNINPACQSHDICYSTCGTSKPQCDAQLKQDILNLCEQTGGAYLEQCKDYADIYYKGVTDQYWSNIGGTDRGFHFGRDAYRDAQKDSNCDGTKYCSPPLPPPPTPTPDPCTKYGNWMCK